MYYLSQSCATIALTPLGFVDHKTPKPVLIILRIERKHAETDKPFIGIYRKRTCGSEYSEFCSSACFNETLFGATYGWSSRTESPKTGIFVLFIYWL